MREKKRVVKKCTHCRSQRTLFLCRTYKPVKSIIIKCENIISMLEAEKFGAAACRAVFDEMIDAV